MLNQYGLLNKNKYFSEEDNHHKGNLTLIYLETFHLIRICLFFSLFLFLFWIFILNINFLFFDSIELSLICYLKIYLIE